MTVRRYQAVPRRYRQRDDWEMPAEFELGSPSIGWREAYRNVVLTVVTIVACLVVAWVVTGGRP
jgi:hypothetical protein